MMIMPLSRLPARLDFEMHDLRDNASVPPDEPAHVPYWSDAELEEVRRFMVLTPTQKLNLLMDALEFLRSAKPPGTPQPANNDSSASLEEPRL